MFPFMVIIMKSWSSASPGLMASGNLPEILELNPSFTCYFVIKTMLFNCKQDKVTKSYLKLFLVAWNTGLTGAPTNTDAGPACLFYTSCWFPRHEEIQHWSLHISKCIVYVLYSTENPPKYISRPHDAVLLWSGTNTWCLYIMSRFYSNKQ